VKPLQSNVHLVAHRVGISMIAGIVVKDRKRYIVNATKSLDKRTCKKDR
jgi:hypothetical protein